LEIQRTKCLTAIRSLFIRKVAIRNNKRVVLIFFFFFFFFFFSFVATCGIENKFTLTLSERENATSIETWSSHDRVSSSSSVRQLFIKRRRPLAPRASVPREMRCSSPRCGLG
jgi:hypothetical protein